MVRWRGAWLFGGLAPLAGPAAARELQERGGRRLDLPPVAAAPVAALTIGTRGEMQVAAGRERLREELRADEGRRRQRENRPGGRPPPAAMPRHMKVQRREPGVAPRAALPESSELLEQQRQPPPTTALPAELAPATTAAPTAPVLATAAPTAVPATTAALATQSPPAADAPASAPAVAAVGAPTAAPPAQAPLAAAAAAAAAAASAAKAAPRVAAASPAADNTSAAAQARQPLARKEAAAASPQVTVVDPEETGKPHPPTHGYTPHPLLVSVLIAVLLLALYAANSLYEKATRGQRPPRKSGDGRLAAGAGKEGAEGGEPPEGGGGPQGGDSDSDEEELTTEPLAEDTYGMAIASMVRDMNRLTRDGGGGHRGIRICRIGVSFKLLLINMALQIFLLVCIANFAAARAVFSIRSAYSDFEAHMYSGHTYITQHNNARGLDDKYFNASRFDTLPEETKGDACRIPFAQPEFLFVILLIWSLLVVGEIKESATLFERLVVGTETTSSMAGATEPCEGGEVIVKLTVSLKAWVALFIVLPRILIASILLWLGCRWLSATTDFQNLVLNAVGLEFVLLLKELLYKSLVPPRDKRDTVRMHLSIAHEASRPSPAAFFGTFLWGLVAAAWVYLYIFCIQGVLPGFRWDVHDVCSQWMKHNYAGWS